MSQPTFCVKVDDAAVGLAPGTQIHSSSFDDVRLAGVGLWSANQNTETRWQKGGNHIGNLQLTSLSWLSLK